MSPFSIFIFKKKILVVLAIILIIGIGYYTGRRKYEQYQEQASWRPGRLSVEGIVQPDQLTKSNTDRGIGDGAIFKFSLKTDKGNIVQVRLADENASLGPGDTGFALNNQILAGASVAPGDRVRVIGGYVGNNLLIANDPTIGDKIVNVPK